MKIEISDRKYWKKLNYLDAKLYIELLSIDGKDNWRFITEKERKKYIKSFSKIGFGICFICSVLSSWLPL